MESNESFLNSSTSTMQVIEINSEDNIRIRKKNCFLRFIIKEKLMILLVSAVITALVLGSTLNSRVRNLKDPFRANLLLLVGFPGEIFLRALKLIIIPLIFSSLVTGMACLDKKSVGKISKYACVYYLFTTLFAVILGIILVVLIHPGKQLGSTQAAFIGQDIRGMDVILDIVRNMFPENIIQATFTQTKSDAKRVYYNATDTVTLPDDWMSKGDPEKMKYRDDNNITRVDEALNVGYMIVEKFYLIPMSPKLTPGMNMIGIIVFSIVFGVLLGRLEKKGSSLMKSLSAIADIMGKMVDILMYISPIGVGSLILRQFWEMDNISGAFASLALYMITVLLGLFLHLAVTLNIIYFVVTRKNPFIFMKNMSKAAFTAFGTSSSAATIPITLMCLEKYNGVRPNVARFMIPVGATVNMDGVALYQGVAAIFIAQTLNIQLTFGQIILTSLTATIASIGAAGVPQGGLITMVMVLQVLGLSSDSIGLILALDWLLDRFMTAINIIGDSYGAGVVDHLTAGSD